jgi:DNA-binding Lrp family transcriptional regulator
MFETQEIRQRKHVDALDHKLLGLLRVDARISTAKIATALDISRGTVANRIARLRKNGTIVGFTVISHAESRKPEVKAWISIAVDGNRTREIARLLSGEPAFTELYDTNGRWDLIGELCATSNTELSEVLERIRGIDGVASTETSIHLRDFRFGGWRPPTQR